MLENLMTSGDHIQRGGFLDSKTLYLYFSLPNAFGVSYFPNTEKRLPSNTNWASMFPRTAVIIPCGCQSNTWSKTCHHKDHGSLAEVNTQSSMAAPQN